MDYLSKIAEELGISRSSVYRAIKHMKPMSVDMRKTVIEHIKNNYPDKLTQLNSLNEGIGSKNIVIIMPYKPEYFWAEAACGMEAAKKNFPDCSVELKYIFYSGTISEDELIYLLGSREVNTADALCIVPVNSEKIAEKINDISSRMPVAIFNEVCHRATAFLNVVSDGYEEGKAIGKMVKDQCLPGSHIVMISTEVYRSNIFTDRICGFYETFNDIQNDGKQYFIHEVNLESSDTYNYHTILPSLIARKMHECIEHVEAKGEKVSATYVINGLLLPLFIALRKLDRHDISVFGHEINSNALEFFKAGMRGGYVKQNIYMQGYTVINGLIKKLFYDDIIYPEIYNIKFDSDSFWANKTN